MDLTYHQATLDFPGSISKDMLPATSHAFFDKVRFVRNGFCIEAGIQPYCLPDDLSENPYVQSNIIEPAIKLVSADIETIDEILLQLVHLAKAGRVQDSLCYNREPTGDKFKVYDYSRVFQNSVNPEDRLFARILLFKGANQRIIPAENRDLVDVAHYVGKDSGKIPHVEGNTLREAVERAISIYNLADRLKRI